MLEPAATIPRFRGKASLFLFPSILRLPPSPDGWPTSQFGVPHIKLRYIHRNPVVRELAARPEDWKWSSFRHYATGLEGTIEIESFWTAARRGGLPDRFRFRAEAVSHISSRYGAPNSKSVVEG